MEKYESRQVAEIKARGGLSIKLLPFNFTGLPDQLVLMPGARVYFVEHKDEGKDIRKVGRQNVVRKILENLGFPWYRVNSEETLREFLYDVEYDQKLKL